ncbi:hypothetical protein N0V94_006930 [Neodidymelliopsis sp. IMI 364377]|nr:hypothetical protein N0V94_006930 [Neodidymelliopsis sp. IMI 364377]
MLNTFGRSFSLSLAVSPAMVASHAVLCEPRAVSLPFRIQKLANQAEMRGISLRVGIARQPLSLVLCAPQAELGVGVNSSFINALQNAGSISSGSYSLFWGDEWSDRPCDGSVTFGGYDRSLLEISHSGNVTKKLTRIEPERCPEGMIVKLMDLSLTGEDGTVLSIFDGLSALSACVVPSMRNIMALPKQYGDRIINGMGGKRLDNGTNGYFNGLLTNTVVITPESATFKGNLSVTMEDVLMINFTTRQLFLQDPYIDSNGVVQRESSRVNVPIVVMYPDSDEMPRLGGMFFNPAYLMVNHDKDEFAIASVRTPKVKPAIVGIDSTNDCVAFVNGSSLVNTSSTLPTSGAKLAPLAIAGISIGAVAGAVLLIGVSLYFWRQGKGNNPLKLSGHKSVNKAHIAEKGGMEVYEAPIDALIQEAGFQRERAFELPTDVPPSQQS